MKLSAAPSALLAAVALSVSPLHAFQAAAPPGALSRSPAHQHATTALFSTPSDEDVRRIMEEESTNPATLADSAEAMKNMTPEDMQKLISEMEKMPDAQKAQLKGMGMDPDTSESSTSAMLNVERAILIQML